MAAAKGEGDGEGEEGEGEVDGAEICILSEFSGIAFGLHAALGTRGN